MERWEFGDPCEVASRRERERQAKEKACGNCMHRVELIFGTEQIVGCGIKKRTYGIRCKSFKKKEIKNGAQITTTDNHDTSLPRCVG